jgi:hypothetical protein
MHSSPPTVRSWVPVSDARLTEIVMKNPASFEAVSKPQGEEEKLDIQGFSQELDRRIGELDRHQQIRAKKWLAKVRRTPTCTARAS